MILFQKFITDVLEVFYSLLGGRLHKKSVIFRNVMVLSPRNLVLGEGSSIGWNCLIDAKGGIKIGKM